MTKQAIAALPLPALEEILAATLTGMSVDTFEADVAKWLGTAKHPRWNRLYTDLTYQPMQEVLQFMRDSGYKTYIATGGGQDFVRVYAQRLIVLVANARDERMVTLGLRPFDRFVLRLGRMQDMVGMIFDHVILDMASFVMALRARLYVHVRHRSLPMTICSRFIPHNLGGAAEMFSALRLSYENANAQVALFKAQDLLRHARPCAGHPRG